jgi:hypothetical protein
MSLKWLQRKLITSKVYKDFEPKEFDIRNDEAVPRRLRDSLISVDSGDISADFSLTWSKSVNVGSAVSGTETPGSISDEEMFEIARSCPDECDHNNCPFQRPRLTSSSEVFVTMHSQFSPSSMSLVRKVSSMTMMEFSPNDQSAFLAITRVVPLRNRSVIIHWNIKSFLGVRGYKVVMVTFV